MFVWQGEKEGKWHTHNWENSIYCFFLGNIAVEIKILNSKIILKISFYYPLYGLSPTTDKKNKDDDLLCMLWTYQWNFLFHSVFVSFP